MNFNMIAYILGNIIRIEAALLAVPAFISIWYQETKAASAFVVTITACLMVGTVLASREPENKRIYGREGFVVDCDVRSGGTAVLSERLYFGLYKLLV